VKRPREQSRVSVECECTADICTYCSAIELMLLVVLKLFEVESIDEELIRVYIALRDVGD